MNRAHETDQDRYDLLDGEQMFRIVCTGKGSHKGRTLKKVTLDYYDGKPFIYTKETEYYYNEHNNLPDVEALVARMPFPSSMMGTDVGQSNQANDAWEFKCPSCRGDFRIKTARLTEALESMSSLGIKNIDASKFF